MQPIIIPDLRARLAALRKHRCIDKTTCKHAACSKGSTAPSANTLLLPDATPATLSTTETAAVAPRRQSVQPAPPPTLTNEYHNASKVLDTQELLEMVLKHLDPRDLVRASRVNKHWRATIDGTSMEKHMFLKTDGRPRIDYELNGALFFLAPAHTTTDWPQAKTIASYGRAKLLANPLRLSSEDKRCEMFLTQPPCTFVHATIGFYRQIQSVSILSRRFPILGGDAVIEGREVTTQISIKVPGGVRLRHLIKRLQNQAREQGSGWELQWPLCDVFLSDGAEAGSMKNRGRRMSRKSGAWRDEVERLTRRMAKR